MLDVPGEYAKAPLMLTRDLGLSDKEAWTWQWIAHYQPTSDQPASDRDGPLGSKRLAEKINTPHRTFQRRLAHLKRAGCAQTIERPGKETLIYARLPDLGQATPAASDDPRQNGAGTPDPRQNGAGTRANLAHPRAKMARVPYNNGTSRTRGEGHTPPPALRDRINGQDDQTQAEILAGAYMPRRTGLALRVDEEEAVAKIARLIRQGASADGMAAFLAATPHVDSYPQKLADEAAAWARDEQQRQVRERIDRIRREGRTAAHHALPDGGQEVGRVRFADAAADPPHLVIEVDRTPPTPTRQDQMADLDKTIAAMAKVSPGCPMELNARAELARLEGGAEPEPPAPEVERLDLRTLEDLDGWQFRAPDGGPMLQDLRRQRGPDAPSPGDAPPPAEPDLAAAREGRSP